jgi:hypothetical protein
LENLKAWSSAKPLQVSRALEAPFQN